MKTAQHGLPVIGATPVHDQIIGGLPEQSPRWLYSSSLFDHDWIVATDDPSKKRNALVRISHDVVVAPGGQRLSDPDREHDLIQSKLLAYAQLQPPSSVTAITANARVRMLHWLIRWREDQGFYRMSDLNSDAVFRSYAMRLHGGVAVLIDWPSRVSRFIDDVDAGRQEIPFRNGDNEEQVVSFEKVAELLGTPTLKGMPASEYAKLYDFFTQRRKVRLRPGSEEVGKLRSTPKSKGGTREILAVQLSLWQCLWDIRHLAVHDPIGFFPFAAKSPRDRASEFTQEVGDRTRTAPEEQVCFLVDRAIRWVVDYSDELLRVIPLLDAVERTDKRPTPKMLAQVSKALQSIKLKGAMAPKLHTGSIYPTMVAKGEKRKQAGTLSYAQATFEMLPTACAIVIATFTARRKDEIASLQEDCVQRDADGDPWMLTWIEKTLRDIDRIPVPEIVVKAVSVLITLSLSARKRNADQWLFGFVIPFVQQSRNHNFYVAMKSFVDFVEVPPLPDGSRWSFAPHQFRRFFSIVYYHRFRYASLTALSAFLKHYDPDMTRRYVTEATMGALAKVREAADAAAAQVAAMRAARAAQTKINEAEIHAAGLRTMQNTIRTRWRDFEDGRLEAEFTRMWAVAAGEEPMGGHRGETLKAELETMIMAARRQIELAPVGTLSEEAAFNDLLRGFVKGHVFEPHPQGHSYCGCGSTPADVALAACLQEKARLQGAWSISTATAPDHTFSDARTCSNCHHNIQMKENRAWWEQRMRSSMRQVQVAVTPHFANVARVDATMCNEHLKRCFDEAPPMTVRLGQRGDDV